MTSRLDATKYLTSGMGRAMLELSSQVEGKVERRLFELVKIRASQINGCAYCLDMHTKEARLAGETEQRIYALNAWRETPFFSDRERAALSFTETVTRLSETHVPRAAYDELAEQFGPDEIGALLGLVITINAWNAASVATRAWEPGSYDHKAAGGMFWLSRKTLSGSYSALTLARRSQVAGG